MRDGRSDLHVMDLSNAAIDRLTDGLGLNQEPSWSPDGTRIVFASAGMAPARPLAARASTWICTKCGRTRPLSAGLPACPVPNDRPAWSCTGSRIAFASDGGCNFDTFTMADDGHDHGQTTDFQRMGGFSAYPRWSPDGSHIVFNAIDPAPGPAGSIYSVGADGNGVRRLTDGYDFKPDWSPDSRWIVFLRQWQGHIELFIVRSDGIGVTQLTDDGADKDGPRWQPS